MPGALVPGIAAPPGRMLLALPSAALPAEIGGRGAAVQLWKGRPARQGWHRYGWPSGFPGKLRMKRGRVKHEGEEGGRPQLMSLGPPPQPRLLLGSKVEEEARKEIESLLDRIARQLAWREGAGAAVTSIHVEGNPGNEVEAEGENLHYSNYRSRGADWQPCNHRTPPPDPCSPLLCRDQIGESRLPSQGGAGACRRARTLHPPACAGSILYPACR